MAARKKQTADEAEASEPAVSGGNIEARLVALKADLTALQADMRGLYGDVSEVASERAAQAMRTAEELADKAMALADEVAADAKAKALEYKDGAEDWAEQNAEELRGHVRAQPLTSLLIAGGVGAFLGAVFLRR